jgi:hypothetical protein
VNTKPALPILVSQDNLPLVVKFSPSKCGAVFHVEKVALKVLPREFKWGFYQLGFDAGIEGPALI